MARSAEGAPESAPSLPSLPVNTVSPPVSTQESVSDTQACKRPCARPRVPCVLDARYHDDTRHCGNWELRHQTPSGPDLLPRLACTGERAQQAASSSQPLQGPAQLQRASMSEAMPLWGQSTLVTEQGSGGVR